MSAHSHKEDLPVDGERFDASKVARIRFLLLAVGGIGLVASAILFFSPLSAKIAYSWLFGFFYFFSLAVGGLFWTLLHNATNSGWGIAVRRVFENLACVIPFLALFAIPLLIPGIRDSLYEWTAEITAIEAKMHSDDGVVDAAAGGAGEDHSIRHAIHVEAKTDPHKHLLWIKYPYLNKPFFYIRAFAYFIILGGIAWWLRKISARQDEDGNEKWTLTCSSFQLWFPLPLCGLC